MKIKWECSASRNPQLCCYSYNNIDVNVAKTKELFLTFASEIIYKNPQKIESCKNLKNDEKREKLQKKIKTAKNRKILRNRKHSKYRRSCEKL